MKTVNIRDVAKESYVSVATVSRVLNESGYVSSQTRQRVMETIERLHFFPNQLAQNLGRQKTNIVGLILPDITNHFFPLVARGIEDRASVGNFQVMLCNSDGDVDTEFAYLKTLIGYKVSGIIFAGSVWGERRHDVVELVREHDIPMVLIDRNIDGIETDTVFVDNIHGGYIATQYLLELGHQKIAFLNGPAHLAPSADRERGYCNALREVGLNIDRDLVQYGEFKYESGIEMAKMLLDRRPDVTAIFAANDLIAVGVLTQIQIAGLRVPEDVAVVGYDNTLLAALVTPSLTSVVQPAYRMGLTAMDILIKRVSEASTSCERTVFRPTLEIRKSCGQNRGISL